MNVRSIEAAARAYEARGRAELNARLAFFRELWRVQGAIEHDAPAWAAPSVREVSALVAAGAPVLGEFPAAVDAAVLGEACARVAACFAAHGSFGADETAWLAGADWADIAALVPAEVAGANPSAYVAALQDALVRDGVSAERARMAALVAASALKPLVEPAATAVSGLFKSGLASETGPDGHPCSCPVCGCAPAAAYVGRTPHSHGNGRLLWCGACGAQWEFERVRCPHCGTRNQEHLHYVGIVGDEAHRLYVCDECGGYLRTRFVEQGELAPFSFEVEDAVMADLDALAARGSSGLI